MVCLYCSAPTSVVNSRLQRRSNTIWRRRACSACKSIFTTIESPELSQAFMLRRPGAKKDLVPFNRDQLFVSIFESCKHRPTALQDAASLTATVISKLASSNAAEPGVITRDQLVQSVHQLLKRFDPAAATYYASYHPSPA